MIRMAQDHVYEDPSWLSGDRLAAKLAVTRAPGAWYASVRFVTGALDRVESRAAFLDLARGANVPMLVIYGDRTPPRSRAEMEGLAAAPGVELKLLPHGKLLIHEEFPDAAVATIDRSWFCKFIDAFNRRARRAADVALRPDHARQVGPIGERRIVSSASPYRGGRVAPPAADRPNRARQRARQPTSPRPRTRSSNPSPSCGESGANLAGCRARPKKARQPASPRPRTRGSNPVPSRGESANHRFRSRRSRRSE